MSIKKKLGMGILTAALGMSLIGGGTFAYFNDFAETNNTFAAGTLDLEAKPTVIVDVDNLKPGDWMTRTFELKNNGTLDMQKVLLHTDYTDNVDGHDFGEYIEVEFLYNLDKLDEVVYRTTLADLQNMTPEAVNQHIFWPLLGERGLRAGTKDDLIVKFNFIDNGQEQNYLQGGELELTWTFEGRQGPGSAR